MPNDTTSSNLKYHQCQECGLMYDDNKTAEECESWCSKHKSCNLEIIKKAVKTEEAIFSAGCFWHVEDKFMQVPGVISTTVGYTGGRAKNPTYEQVCSHKTGHAEAVRIVYDPAIVSYSALLDIFWAIHDPTQLNRQGPDIGSQYRSSIFYHSEVKKKLAEESKDRLSKSGRYKNAIVTEIAPVSKFYKAEEYHQKYFKKHGLNTCPS